MPDPRQRLYAIRRQAIEEMPFLAPAILHMTPVESEQCPYVVSADDDGNLYYNPDKIAVWDNHEASALVLAEAIRYIQNHAGRLRPLLPDSESGQSYVQLAAQIASDAVIADLLDESGVHNYHAHPATHVVQALLKTKHQIAHPAVETVFRMIEERLPPMPPMLSAGGDEEGQNREGTQQNTAQAQEQQRRYYATHIRDNNSSIKIRSACHGLQNGTAPAGSSIDGVPRPWEHERRDPSQFRPNQHPGSQQQQSQSPQSGQSARGQAMPMGHDSRQQVSQQVAKNIVNSTGKRPGSMPGWYQWARETLQQQYRPTRDLMAIIRSYASTTGGARLRRYDGRNRRQQQFSEYNHQQLVMPTYHDPEIELAVLLDTSGSMGKKALKRAVAYIVNVLRSLSLDGRATLYMGDADVRQPIDRITTGQLQDMRFVGGGGTNMGICLHSMLYRERSHGRTPNLVIVCTDGYTPWGLYADGHRCPCGVAVAITPDDGDMCIQDVLNEYPVPNQFHVVDLTYEARNAPIQC